MGILTRRARPRLLVIVGALIAMLLVVGVAFATHGDDVVDMTYSGATVEHNGAMILQGGVGAGTGNWDPYLTVSSNKPQESGVNSIKALKQFDSFYGGTRTHPLLASAVPSILYDSNEDGTPELWREFGLDANDQGRDTWMSIDVLKVFLTDTGEIQYNPATETFNPGNMIDKIYDLDGSPILMISQGLESGSGVSDISVLLPDEDFPCEYGALVCDTWVVMYTEYGAATFIPGQQMIGEFGENDAADYEWDVSAGFEEWRTQLLPVVNVQKTAIESFDREYTWDITKSVTPPFVDLFAGNSDTFDYTVFADRTITDSGFNVSGEVTITNPTGGDIISDSIPADITAIEDGLAGYDSIALNCPETVPFTLGAGDSIICTYSVTDDVKFSDSFAGDNVASVTIDIEGEPRTYSATERVDFTGVEPTITGYENVNVTDTNGDLGLAEGDTTWPYAISRACSSEPSVYTDGFYTVDYDNTATITETGDFDDASVTVNCYAPVVEKDAAGSYDERHDWDVVKTVSPLSQGAFAGDPVGWTWTIDIIETMEDENFAVTGDIDVTNPTGSPGNMTVSLVDVLDDATAATVDCGSGATNVTVAPGATETCSYSAAPDDGSATLNTATGTFNSIDFVDTASVTFVKTVVNGSATVSDTEIGLTDESVSGGDQFTGVDGDVCSSVQADYGDNGMYDGSDSNTATLVDFEGTEYESTATTDYTCYAPVVTKNVGTYFTRTFEWDITKTALQTSFEVIQGEQVDIPYSVTVDVIGHTDDGWGVDGEIFVYNPHPTATMTVTDVSDVAGGITAAVSCPSLDVGPLSTLTCTYDTGAQTGYPDANPFESTNTATAVFAGSDWTGSADIVFGDPTELVDETIDVDDDQVGFLGTVGYDEAPHTFTYTRTVFAEELECGDNFIDNTATLTTNDTGTTASASARVNIYVLCGETRLTPTNTECRDFRDFPDAAENNLEYLYYDADSGFVTNVTPGAMFYWIEVIHSGGALAVDADQTTSFGRELSALDVKFYDGSCSRVLDVSFVLSGGDAELTASSLAAGTYYMQVRYDPKSLIGGSTDGTSSYTFDFSALVNGSATIPDSLMLAPKP